MAGCGLPRPAAKSLQSGRGLLHRHREPQLVFATLLKCYHPLEPVPCFGDAPSPEKARFLFVIGLHLCPNLHEGRGRLVDGLDQKWEV